MDKDTHDQQDEDSRSEAEAAAGTAAEQTVSGADGSEKPAAATGNGATEEGTEEHSASGTDEEEAAEPTLEEQLEAARAEAAANHDLLLRARAELENVLKRQRRELEERARYEGLMISRDLLAVVDDLERALDHSGGEDGASIVSGIELVLKSMLAILEKHGVVRVEAAGQPFDPAVHEAVAMVETTEVEPNTVVEEHRCGYQLRDRLLRPAMVVVSKAPPAADGEGSEGKSS